MDKQLFLKKKVQLSSLAFDCFMEYLVKGENLIWSKKNSQDLENTYKRINAAYSDEIDVLITLTLNQ